MRFILTTPTPPSRYSFLGYYEITLSSHAIRPWFVTMDVELLDADQNSFNILINTVSFLRTRNL